MDVSCGIGTQSLALAALGLDVTASDLSPEAVERAQKEAEARGLGIKFSVCDMKEAYQCHGGGGCHITMRQYDQEKGGTGIFKPFGVRDEGQSPSNISGLKKRLACLPDYILETHGEVIGMLDLARGRRPRIDVHDADPQGQVRRPPHA